MLMAELEVEELNEGPLGELAQIVERSAASRRRDGLDSADAATVLTCDALRELLSGCGWAPLFANPAGVGLAYVRCCGRTA